MSNNDHDEYQHNLNRLSEEYKKYKKMSEQGQEQDNFANQLLKSQQPTQPQPYNPTLGIQKFDPNNVDPRTGTKNSAYVDLDADELTKNIKPSLQATDAQINDPNWMRARGLVPMQDLESSIQSADKQNRALATAADAGFPTYQYQGQTYGVKNPAYGKGGTTSQPKPLTPQQIQQMAGTNIKSGSGAPVTAGSRMNVPNAAGTSSGSLKENQYRQLINLIEATEKGCPPATQSIELNLKNRKKAIDEYMYGPLDPNEPNVEFWQKIADEWNMDNIDQAKSARCGNCAAFDITDKMQDCIAQGIGSESGSDPMDTVDAGTLGYCKFLKFKCAAKRTCSAWVEGGPITDDKK